LYKDIRPITITVLSKGEKGDEVIGVAEASLLLMIKKPKR